MKRLLIGLAGAAFLFAAGKAEAHNVSCHAWDSDFDGNADTRTCLFDDDHDGRADWIRDQRYDSLDRLVEEKHWYTLPAKDPDWTRRWAYDAHGRVIARDTDINGDGLPDVRTGWEYDDQGRVMARSHDLGADGMIDYEESFLYDEQGRMLVEEYDFDGDGTTDMSITYGVDGQARVVPEER